MLATRTLYASLCVAACLCQHADAGGFPGPQPPSVIQCKVEPRYTPEALRAGVRGTALIRLAIDESGAVTQATLTRWHSPDNHPPLGLDNAALDAVRQWKFVPPTRNGRPSATNANVEIHFTPELEKSRRADSRSCKE